MKNTRKILKIFTCLNFGLISALAPNMSSEAMMGGGGRRSSKPSQFGESKNRQQRRRFRNSSETSMTNQQAQTYKSDYMPNPYDPPKFKEPNPAQLEDMKVLPANFQIHPNQINSIRNMEETFPMADYILYSLDFRIPTMDELLKLIPNITMKGIMGQLLDQYGRKFPYHEMILSCLTQSAPDKSPINVLDYNNPTKYETGVEAIGQYIDVQFTRILVKPVAYALRADFTSIQTNHLKTFTFSGKLPNGKWIILDERVNIYPFARPTAIVVFFVNTSQYFQAFRITQTGPSHAGAYKFSLAGFDIHGDVIQNK